MATFSTEGRSWFGLVGAFLLSSVASIVAIPVGAWNLLTKLKLVVPSAFLPQEVRSDEVFFTVTAPATVAVGMDAELMVWAHLQKEEKLVLHKAMAALGISTLQKLLTRSSGPVPLVRGATASLVLQIDGIIVANQHRQITWTGRVGNANFVFSVPREAEIGSHKATCFVRVEGLEIARIDFLLRVGDRNQRRDNLSVDLKRYKTAFASYASEDREIVLAHSRDAKDSAQSKRVVDVMSLQSGEMWAEKLNEVVSKVDVFYLFWCGHARESEWVEKEWRCAYDARGLSFIGPVPLESPEFAPPPRELSGKHFNDPVLALMNHTRSAAAG